MLRTLPSYLSLALRNLARSPLRSGLTITGIAVSVAVFLTITAFYGGYRRSLDRTVERMGYEVLVTAKGCPYEAATLVMKGGNIPMYVDERVFDELRKDPDVGAISRMFMQGTPAATGSKFQVYLGVDDAYLKLKPWMKLQRGRFFEGAEASEAVLGYNVAEYLRLDLGAVIEAGPKGQTVKVVGVFDKSGTQDDGLIFLPLGFAQEAFDRQGKLTGIAVKLAKIERMDSFIERAFEIPSVQVITLAQVRGTILDLVSSARIFITAAAFVAILVASLGVFNSTMMSVLERSFEIGVMKVLGASPANVFAIVWIESALICLSGGALGAALTIVLGRFTEEAVRSVIPYAPPGHIVALTAPIAFAGLAGTLGIGLLAGFYPALKASLLRPIRSMRGTL
ncbi:MAG TPA: ABC transporter permease [Verrucomicrobiae bacterium]|nr:ABC transporter permease [Verrucomicrobiae bacterium]